VRIHKERALRTSPRSWGGWGLVVNNSSVRAPDRLDAVSTSARPAAKRFDVVMTIVLLVALPSLVYYLWICLAFNHGKPMIPSAGMFNYFPLPTGTSIGIVSGWLLFQAMLQQYAPGNWAEGTVLADGTRLAYRMNGWFAWWFTLLVLAGGVALNLFSPTILADQFAHMRFPSTCTDMANGTLPTPGQAATRSMISGSEPPSIRASAASTSSSFARHGLASWPGSQSTFRWPPSSSSRTG
jgi:hypothetical protein